MAHVVERSSRDSQKGAAFAAHFFFCSLCAAAVFAGGWLLGVERAFAAVPVEESVAERQAETRAAPPPPTYQPQTQPPAAPSTQAEVTEPAGASRLGELFYQLQIMQQEVQELRGLMEEQTYQLNRLARDQKQQYIDLDRRVAALRNNAPTPVVSTSPRSTTEPELGTRAPTASGTEREAYTSAFNLMKNRQFDESADAFNQMIADYPNGQYTPNAFYWLGELYLAGTDAEMARQSFAQVVNLYPDHQKVPDALYKLGVVYHRLGDDSRSLEYLNRVQADYPATSAAGLATTYASELQ